MDVDLDLPINPADLYADECLDYMYNMSMPLNESQLPPVYVSPPTQHVPTSAQRGVADCVEAERLRAQKRRRDDSITGSAYAASA
jgi:hypothetical protein